MRRLRRLEDQHACAHDMPNMLRQLCKLLLPCHMPTDVNPLHIEISSVAAELP